LPKLSGSSAFSPCRIRECPVKATSRLPIENTTKCSQVTLGFGFGNGTEFVAAFDSAHQFLGYWSVRSDPTRIVSHIHLEAVRILVREIGYLGVLKYTFATFDASVSGFRSDRLASRMSVRLPSVKRSITVLKPMVSP
jgi:hypothetical protein